MKRTQIWKLERLAVAMPLILAVALLAGCPSDSERAGGSSEAPESAASDAMGGAAAPSPAMAEPEKAPTPAPAKTAAPEPEAVVDDGETVRVALTGNDALQFNLKEIRVEQGRTIRLTLSHIGKGSVDSMGHNFVLLEIGTDLNAFGLAAASARETDFIPPSMEDAVIVHTDVIGGGESVTIEFPAPPPGSYDFICSFTGHFGTMRGKLIVSE